MLRPFTRRLPLRRKQGAVKTLFTTDGHPRICRDPVEARRLRFDARGTIDPAGRTLTVAVLIASIIHHATDASVATKALRGCTGHCRTVILEQPEAPQSCGSRGTGPPRHRDPAECQRRQCDLA